MYPILALYSDLGIFILRVVLGLVLSLHGFQKIKNLKGTNQWFDSIGFKPGVFWGTLVTVVELFGGLSIILGIGTQIIAALIAIQFIVIIIWKLMSKQSLIGGYEFDLLIFAVALLLITIGSGAYALEQYLFSGY